MRPDQLQILQVTLQALSAFAIAGGLLYTAFQFRQAALSYQSLWEGWSGQVSYQY